MMAQGGKPAQPLPAGSFDYDELRAAIDEASNTAEATAAIAAINRSVVPQREAAEVKATASPTRPRGKRAASNEDQTSGEAAQKEE